MDPVLEFLDDEEILLLTTLLALGALLGRVRLLGVPVGPAAVLFAALGVSALGAANDVSLELNHLLGTLGLVLFTFTVGVIGGPTFFSSLRTGWRLIVGTVVVLCLAAVTAVLVGNLLGLRPPIVAGTFAGALTNTPALAAATEQVGGSRPTVGYSLSYLFGVVGMMLAAAWVLRRPSEAAAAPLVHQTIRVDRPERISVADLMARYDDHVTFSRLKHEHAANPTEVAEEGQTIGPRDLVTVVGPAEVVDRVTADLGHPSSHDIVGERWELDYRRITLSNASLAGLTVSELGLDQFGAVPSRVRRGDVDMVAQPELVVQMGDRLRVIAPLDRMDEVNRYLGDSERGLSDINPIGLALGISLGILLGLVPVPLPGGGEFSLGAAAGTLILGLIFGRVGRIGPLVTSMPHGAASTISSLGMITFLAYAGTTAGGALVETITSPVGWKVILLGIAITTVAAVLLLVAAALARSPSRQTAGVLGGAQTQPAVLAYADERTGSDPRVAVGYALVYPAAMITKILLAQLLAGLG
ncbi:aspartate:alanine exchanger family transporter [Nocardioides campestrisoli]|uniref:aspartate:alanine exchanger family transporter n=1 Tax=Nocardioides campestrisoli TaxID=2736757 RepID=UPI0015E7D404|nr:TrkA C-terminal domain-containing protein [Nocardioides campestrisoli]